MKIICIDNYNRESVAQWSVAENVKPNMAEWIVKLLNNSQERGDSDWFYAVDDDDDYRLWRGMEDLV